MRARVDPNHCQGHGLCQMSAPNVFALREEDGTAYVLDEQVPAEFADEAVEGADSCPERAITVD